MMATIIPGKSREQLIQERFDKRCNKIIEEQQKRREKMKNNKVECPNCVAMKLKINTLERKLKMPSIEKLEAILNDNDSTKQVDISLNDKVAVTNKVPEIEILKEWIKDLLPGYDFDKYVKVIEDNEDVIQVNIYTESRHHYNIRGDIKRDYLGCVRSSDFHLAGEDHTRGRDLPDGPFNEETWRRIVNAIVCSELIELGT